jgi:hypothetical protein
MQEGQPAPPTNVIAIVSSEFYKWPELLNRMKAALSARPAEAIYTLEKRTSLSRTNTQMKSKPNSPILTSATSKSPEDDVVDPEKTAEGKAEIEEFEPNHEDTESELGDDLFVTPFATGGSEFPFEHTELNNRSSFDTWRHTMDLESLRQLRDADASTKEEADEHILRKALDSPVIKGKEPSAALVTKPVSPAQLFMTPILPAHEATDTTISSSRPSRTPSPSPSISTIDSTSTTTTASTISTPTEPSKPLDPLSLPLPSTPLDDELSSSLNTSFTLEPLSLPRSAITHSLNDPSPLDPHLYLIPQTAHLSQSDFGVLFPNLVRYLMKAENAVDTIELNVRAVLDMMVGCGIEVDGVDGGKEGSRRESMLSGGYQGKRWERVDIY